MASSVRKDQIIQCSMSTIDVPMDVIFVYQFGFVLRRYGMDVRARARTCTRTTERNYSCCTRWIASRRERCSFVRTVGKYSIHDVLFAYFVSASLYGTSACTQSYNVIYRYELVRDRTLCVQSSMTL